MMRAVIKNLPKNFFEGLRIIKNFKNWYDYLLDPFNMYYGRKIFVLRDGTKFVCRGGVLGIDGLY